MFDHTHRLIDAYFLISRKSTTFFVSSSVFVAAMKLLWSFLFLSCLCLGFLGHGYSEKPEVVKIGSIFSFNSVIGKVAKIAIEEAVKDVNSNPDILVGTRLQVSMQNSNCSGFMGMVEGKVYFS